jgi:hypothetical protein
VTVRGDLYASCDPARAIIHELLGPSRVTTPNEIRNDQFSLSVDSDPSPNVAPAFLFLFRPCILGLGSDELPNFIGLETAHLQIADVAVMVSGAGGSEIGQQFDNCRLGNSGHPDCGANGATLDQAANHLGSGRIV